MGSPKNGAFKYLKHQVWSRVQGWIERTISTGGKEVLVEAVAQVVPVYSMSCFKLSKGLWENLNMLIRKFWLGSKDGRRKPHWVSWKDMTQSKGMGSLEFKDFELFNLPLLASQACHILQNMKSWVSIFRPLPFCKQIWDHTQVKYGGRALKEKTFSNKG